MHELALRARPRDAPASPGQQDRARHVARLRQPLEQLDVVVDGLLLSEALRTLVTGDETAGLDPFEWLGVADLAWPGAAASALRQLAGVEPRADEWPLGPGRFPLYVCPMCGDLGCGAITVEIVRGPRTTTWRDLRLEDGWTPADEMVDLSALGPWTFTTDAATATLLEPTHRLDALAAEDDAALAQQPGRPAGAFDRLVRWLAR